MLPLFSKLVTGFASTPPDGGPPHGAGGGPPSDPCACIGLDPTWVLDTAHANLPNINVYGLTCAGAFHSLENRTAQFFCPTGAFNASHACVTRSVGQHGVKPWIG